MEQLPIAVDVVVNVTQEDIEAGQAGSCKTCPIALAINRIFPTTHASVWPATSILMRGSVDDGNLRRVAIINLPEVATQFIEQFDKTARGPNPEKFESFSFIAEFVFGKYSYTI